MHLLPRLRRPRPVPVVKLVVHVQARRADPAPLPELEPLRKLCWRWWLEEDASIVFGIAEKQKDAVKLATRLLWHERAFHVGFERPAAVYDPTDRELRIRVRWL